MCTRYAHGRKKKPAPSLRRAIYDTRVVYSAASSHLASAGSGELWPESREQIRGEMALAQTGTVQPEKGI